LVFVDLYRQRPIEDNTKKERKLISLPGAGFAPTISILERQMTVHSLVRTVALIDGPLIISVQYIVIKTLSEQALLLVLKVWVLPQFSGRFRYILGVIYVYVIILVDN
jgi:hypothetical protein